MIERIKPEDEPQVIRDTRAYIRLGREIDALKDLRDGVKARLLVNVEMEGSEDDKGHDWLELPEDIDGVYGLQRQHRVKRVPDEEAIERILEAKGLYDLCVKTVETVDQDAIMGCHARGQITDEELDEMFPAKVSYAFVTVKR